MLGSVTRAAWRAITAALFFASAHIAAAEIIGEYGPIPCDESEVFLAPSFICVTAVGRGATDSRSVSGIHSTAGKIGDISLHFTLLSTGYGSFIYGYGEDASVGIIKDYHKVTRDLATSWSSIKTDGNTSYMTFTIGLQSCLGFDHAGPLVPGGYQWMLRGFLCMPGDAASLTVLTSYLAATRIGPPARDRNAFGQPVAPLPAPPNPT